MKIYSRPLKSDTWTEHEIGMFTVQTLYNRTKDDVLDRFVDLHFSANPTSHERGRKVSIELTLAEMLLECEKLAGSKLAVIDLLLDAVGKDMEKLIFDLAHERAKASDLPADTA